MVLSLGLSALLCQFVGLAYPTYSSFKALQTFTATDDAQWLTYWVVYALYGLVEGALKLTKWMPLYFELKLAVLVWLVAPQTKGAELVYERIVAPALKTHAARLDPVFSGAERVLKSKQIGQVADLAKKYGPATAQKVIEEAAARAAEVAASAKPPVGAS